MRGLLVDMKVIAPSNKGAPKKPPQPASNAPETPQAQMAKDAQGSNVTPAQGAVSGKVLTDKAYDLAVAAFITTLGIRGKDSENVRLAFGPSSLEQTLRLLASTYG
jgi:hypothetical protein